MVKSNAAQKRMEMMKKVYEGGYVMIRKSTIIIFFTSYFVSGIIIAIVGSN